MHTPLVAWIANYPEQLLIACVSAKNSPISLAMAEQFGDAATACDPCNIVAFHKACLALHLNGVMEPFWKDWGDTCPSHFLTPNALHQWHKFYFDHCVHWVINIIGAALQPRIGTRHWCTGQEHHELEKLLPAVAAGALPDDVLCALHTITKFIFLAQGISHYDKTIHSLSEAHSTITNPAFSGHMAISGRMAPLTTFRYQNICQMGAPYQQSSNITEHCHITHVKAPYHLSNC
ncbi:hypothetical protein F5J12DRAFT_907523 [Pisolithus orientalis]|uniref:uncharacterized protein n=1 Tax=Pisolithus orientalis TaxID=936130 RepID=UPI00222520CC|nr:uncharacterized protein F5J12DRAFT_907523 [Pisolithus orientalis]KAI5991066.1 hypothetical protein F5J12DRAFT_907523 [Pisolithus orientalis]